MAASITRIIREALLEIIQSKDATTAERLEDCRLLWKARTQLPRARLAAEGSPKKQMASVNSTERLITIVEATLV
jgi:hypothetical protein